MSEDARKIGILGLTASIEEAEEGLSDDEQAWGGLFKYMAAKLKEADEVCESIVCEGIVEELDETETEIGVSYFMRFEASDIDEHCNPSTLLINLYENGLHSQQVFALANWNGNTVNVLVPERDSEIRNIRKHFSLKELIFHAQSLVEEESRTTLDDGEPHGLGIPVFPVRPGPSKLLN